MTKDTVLYDRLNIKPDSSENEIKKSYRKLSLKYHPDKNKSEDSKEKFQKISEAYNILKDVEKRKEYDMIGMDIFTNNKVNFDGFDIFNSFFKFNNESTEAKDNCNASLNVTLKQIYQKNKVKVVFQKKIYCKKCNGFGTKNGKNPICGICNGQGRVTQLRQMGPMIQQVVFPCNDCKGKGKEEIKDKCNECNGLGYNLKEENYKFKLTHDMKDKSTITISGEGHNFKDYTSDLIIILSVEKNDIYERENNNIIMTKEIPFYQSVFGFKDILNYLDDKKYLIYYDNKISNDTVLELKNKGFNDGVLKIKFIIKQLDFTKYTEKELEILKKLLCKNDLEFLHVENGIKLDRNKYENLELKKNLYNYDESDKSDKSNESNEREEYFNHREQCAHQ
jgi:DnaJ-class molecular chaperone